MTVIDVYISLNSPWTFLSWRGFLALRDKHGFKIAVKPARFGDVFAQTGGLPLPKRAPARRAYRMMELKRWRDVHGIPLVVEPTSFPSDETAGTHLVLAAAAEGADAARLAQEIGHALWVRDERISEPAVLAAAARRAGLDAAVILAKAAAPAELEAKWQANTDEAVARGVFGAPSFVLGDGEIFWGQDRVDLLGWRLGQRQT